MSRSCIIHSTSRPQVRKRMNNFFRRRRIYFTLKEQMPSSPTDFIFVSPERTHQSPVMILALLLT